MTPTISRRRLLIWAGVGALAVLAVLVLVVGIQLRPAKLKALAEQELAARLNLDVSVEHVALTWMPRPRVSGTNIVFRVPGRPDLAPFVSVARFSADVGLFSALRGRVDTVHLDGLKIAVPPADARAAMSRPGGDTGASPSSSPSASPATTDSGDVIVAHLITHEAELSFQPKKPGGRPLLFQIHSLEIHDLGLGRRWPFHARLTNPVPRGLVESSGTIGPWSMESPSLMPVAGEYTLTDADLGTINGIGGILQSTGKYEGILTEIRATGSSTTPDFSLDLGGKPLPLETTFVVTINGTEGSVRLDDVQARLLNTPIHVTGAIANLPGPGRHDVQLQTQITDGRIEDILLLAVDAAEPVLAGDLTATSTISLPPGDTPVRRRLSISGRFGLEDATFNSATVTAKLRELSRRSQGKDEDERLGRVVTDLSGRYTLENGVLTLPGLAFVVPGARINLGGTYRVDDGALDFRGTLRMEASISEAVGGFKSIFIKPFDGLFRKQGAGAVIPIKIEGTRFAPKFGVEMGRILK
jgi:hypothetical protein